MITFFLSFSPSEHLLILEWGFLSDERRVYSLYCSQSLVQVDNGLSANFAVSLETDAVISSGTGLYFYRLLRLAGTTVELL